MTSDAGVRDDDVEATEPVDRRSEESIEIGDLRNVSLYGDRLRTGTLDGVDTDSAAFWTAWSGIGPPFRLSVA